jgi:hypothetical protein
MDPVGLAIGIVGLFSTCLDLLDKVDDYRGSSTESQILTAIFDAEKRRFEQWGEAVGLRQDILEEVHHKAFDDPLTQSKVEQLLAGIQEIFLATSDATFPRPVRTNTLSAKQGGSTKSQAPASQIPRDSRRSKLHWTMRGKGKRKTQIEHLTALVQSLHNLVPCDGIQSYSGATAHDDLSRESK